MAAFATGAFSDPPRTQRDDETSPVEDGPDYCRICRGEASAEQPLFYPCKCSGSIKYVHQDCLMEWLSHSQKKYCELCKTHFRFTKLYDNSMPATLPVPLFLQQLVLHAVKALSRWARYLLVGFIWTCCLPWCIRQIWRGLFWLADGSWLSEGELRKASADQLEWNSTTANTADNIVFYPLTNTTLRVDDRPEPPMVSLLTMVFRFLSSDALIAKILRVLFSIPPVQFGAPSTSRSSEFTNATLLERPPSLLSEVRMIKSLTSSDAVNHAFIDTFEGQLICILLIAAFILVFLIREWVINQQPILNMPDPDVAENPVPPVVPQDIARPIVRRRRGVLRRGIGPNVLPVPPGAAAAARPMAIPMRRRALTDDNIAVAGRPELERPELPTRANSLVPDRRYLDINRVGTGSARYHEVFDDDDDDDDDDDNENDEDEQLVSPPLMRGALGHAVNIQRTIEEGTINPEAHADFVLTPTASPDEPVSAHLEEDSGREAPRVRFQAFPTTIEDSQDEVEGSDEGQQEGLLRNTHGQQEDISDSDEAVALTQTVSDESNETSARLSDDLDAPQQQPTITEQGGDDKVEAPSTIQRLAQWLWYTEGFVPQPPVDVTQDEEHRVADPQAEAPFVPVHHREADGLHGPRLQPQQQPLPPALLVPPAAPVRAREPNVQFGIDLNDPNALDDAEDLDGILELVGMEGPLAGMVQNVIFSLFLITLTLTASVWIPYIWGKLALLFLANPVIVFIRAPLYLLSKTADVIADMVFFVFGLTVYTFNHVVKVVKMLVVPILPAFGELLDTSLIERLSLDLTHNSGTRLEKTLSGTFLNFRPDLPTFSMQSHHALRVFKKYLSKYFMAGLMSLNNIYTVGRSDNWTASGVIRKTATAVKSIPMLPYYVYSLIEAAIIEVKTLSLDLKLLSFHDPPSIDYTLIDWSTEDKIIAIVLGYCFFATAGFVFLKTAHAILGLKEDEKVEGTVADTLRQAGGVLKVVVIIGIEMILFPLYCGCLLDLALLPLFEGASADTRLAFVVRAPFTGLFIHWFIGTCYMFHFALFVSMCRKIMRKGVLYFIRDPDDPTFHPVRDVLERPVPNQLGKIAFSGLVYGGLVIMCLGGVVWVLDHINGVLPIRWATDQPRLAFPVDVIFYNFMLPFIVRKAEPSKKIALMYEWWFRNCAGILRLSHFLFGKEREEEKVSGMLRLPWRDLGITEAHDNIQKDGSYVRAPASDSCRIPKNTKAFLEVNENNERLDGQPEQDKGVHGKNDERFAKIYIPPHFKIRVGVFIVLLWMFAACTGVGCTIGPLLVGRGIVRYLAGSGSPPNDLYALTVGAYILSATAYAIGYSRLIVSWARSKIDSWFMNHGQIAPIVLKGVKYVVGNVYLIVSIGVVLPFTLSLISELYIHIPLLTYFFSAEKLTTSLDAVTEKPSPVVFILQTWTLGLLYLRLALRLALTYPSPDTQVATAIRAIARNGFLHLDGRLATRAIILPAAVICTILLITPLGLASTIIFAQRIQDTERQMHIYRLAYPGLLGAGLACLAFVSLRRKIAMWRVKIRDEVYLIGERLHNFHETSTLKRNAKGKEKIL